ncbi:unnamed protein product [Toxocara canis]|uniref:'chromo' domain containing protein n=1 Tax=Toxocara canis TaxID=6265 RepID=A0A183UE07_TOXCA|nr:unnamed protein product [Toxocara canis]
MMAKKRPSFASLRRDLHLHNFFRQTNFGGDFSNPSGVAGVQHLLPGSQPRRESFLYRPTTDERDHNVPCRSVSRASSVASTEHQ